MEEALRTVTETDIVQVEEGGRERGKTDIIKKTGPQHSQRPTKSTAMEGYKEVSSEAIASHLN